VGRSAFGRQQTGAWNAVVKFVDLNGGVWDPARLESMTPKQRSSPSSRHEVAHEVDEVRPKDWLWARVGFG